MQKRIQHSTYQLCQNCGVRFEAKRFHARTCSDKCRKALSRAGRKDETPKTKSQIKSCSVTLQHLEDLVKEHVK